MTQPKALARGLLLGFTATTMIAACGFFAPRNSLGVETVATGTPSGRAPVIGGTPGYAGAHLVRLDAAPPGDFLDHLVISEFRSRGPNSNGHQSDEFVEIFNATSVSVSLNNKSIYRLDCAPAALLIAALPNVDLLPGQHWLIGGQNYSEPPVPDQAAVDIGVDDAGGIALIDGLMATDPVIDAVSTCEDSPYPEGDPLQPLIGTSDQSYDRAAQSDGVCGDTGNNASDFFLRNPSDPQNSTSPVTSCGNATPTIIASLTPTSSPTRTITPTRTPLGFHPRLMINELGWAGTQHDAGAQWIELYNSGVDSVNLDDGWSLESPSGGFEISLHGTVGPGQYFLLVAGGSTDATSVPTISANPTTSASQCVVFKLDDVQIDQVFTGSLSTSGQILYLINPSNGIEDSADRLGRAWPAGAVNPARSMERSGIITDTTVGAWFTFEGPTASNPRDCGNNRVRGTPRQANWALSVTATPSPTPPRPRTPTPRPPTPFAHMIINEFLPRAGSDWNRDGEINVYDEFIEIKNNGPIDGDLAGWKLDDVADGGSPPFTLPSVKLKPGERAVFYGLQTNILQDDSGDTIRLVDQRNIVIDARDYGVVETRDVSHCRLPDGYYWRTACFATPGNENALSGVAPAPAAIILSAPPPCLLADTVPAPFRDAECNGFGGDVYDRSYWDDTLDEAAFIMMGPLHKWKTILE